MGDISVQLSGRFVLRIAPSLHARLRERAREAGISLNDYCARKLGAPEPWTPASATPAIEHVGEILGDDAMGVIVYGSWARGEAAAGSDVDLLIVLREGVALTRDLYRRWDENPPTWGDFPIEPHFVRLPSADGEITSTWAEVALDGIVLDDPTLILSRSLATIRRRIAEGEITRSSVHGQPYWTLRS